MAEDTKVTGQSTKGETWHETQKRKGQAKSEGEMADKEAVREGMKPGSLAAAARANAAKRALAGGGKADVDFKNLGRVAPGRKKVSSRSMTGRRA